MGRAYTIQYHPFPLRGWLHDHQWLVRASLGLIVAIMLVAIAAPTASMIRDAIAEHSGSITEEAETSSAATLPREWIWSLESISFDHMYRQSTPGEVMDYSRVARHQSSSSAPE